MRIALLLLALILTFALHAAEDPTVVPSALKTVTVYRSGAELTHQTSAPLQQGSEEVIIEGISNNVDMNSLQITVPSAVTILSTEFGTNFLVLPEVSTRIKALQDSSDRLGREIDRVAVQIATTLELLEVLKANRDIKGRQTGLSVAELAKLMDYYKAKSSELQNDLAVQKERQQKLSTLSAKLKAQIREEETKNTRARGQLKLQLSVATASRYDFTVSYITPNAYWTPYYDVRVDDIKSPLKLIYKAKVVQTTGIDWKKVKLSLSTSVPTQWGQAPVLKAWFLSYINPVALMERDLRQNRIQSFGNALTGRMPGLSVEESEYKVKLRGYTSMTADAQPLYIVNGAAMSADNAARLDPNTIKSVEVLKEVQATSIYGARAANGVVLITLKDGLSDYVSVTDNELNVNFDIDLPYDVPTNGKEQTATLKEYTVSAFYKYYAVPRMDKDAYLLAEVSDWEGLNLMPGDANIIFEGTYVGKSFIDPASTSDTLNLTLGRDKRVVLKREKLADFSSVKFLGANKLQKMTYEITVKNNKKEAVQMMLKDQYPLTTNKDVEVELLEEGGASVNAEAGVLTWKIELAPSESRKLRFAYSVKYPKDKVLNLN